MKKIMFALFMSLLTLTGFAQTYTVFVEGMVKNQETGLSVSGQRIDIMTDSLEGGFYYWNSVITDPSGIYQDSFEVPGLEGGQLYISTVDCHSVVVMEIRQFSPNNTMIVADFTLCVDPAGGNCQALFSFYPIDNSFSLQFNDLSTGNPTEWQWSFGDGTGSTEQNPVHTFYYEGAYPVELTISNPEDSCFSSFEMIIWIGNDTIWPDECTASYDFMQDSLNELSFYFFDRSIGFGGTEPETWNWDFGDGNFSSEQNPVHTFPSEGLYNVCLTITDSSGICENTFCMPIEVINWSSYCQAQYYYYPVADSNPAGNPMTFQFMDFSFGNPDTWYWDFGDGNTSSEQNPIHTFENNQYPLVCLSISNDADSCFSTYCEYISINNDSTLDCYGWIEYTVNDLSVAFQGITFNNGNGQFNWEFGDGTSGEGISITHIYAEDGVYNVTMYFNDPATGCSFVSTSSVWVGEITFPVQGYVFLLDSLMVDAAYVYLLTYDTLSNGLVSVAETAIDANGFYSFEEMGLNNCIYYVQAELTGQSAYFGEYLPTYHVDALTWQEAFPVIPFFPNSLYNIILQSGEPYNIGSGTISGLINGVGTREQLSNIEIVLLNENGSPLTYIRTTEEGYFEFTGLPFGTYIVHAEILGVNSTHMPVTLTADNPTSNISIIVANNEAMLGISTVSADVDQIGDIFPNPVSGNGKLLINAKKDANVNLIITNQYGQQLSVSQLFLKQGSKTVTIESSQLNAGIYFITVQTKDGIKQIRKFVKVR